MSRRRVGNASTKYCLEPERLEADIENKLEVYAQFKKDIWSVINHKYRYSGDNGCMSDKAKRKALLEVHQDFIKSLGG